MSEQIGPVPPAPAPAPEPLPEPEPLPADRPPAVWRSAIRRWKSWVPVVAAAVVAFVAGATAEYVTAPDYTETEEYAAAQTEFDDREVALDRREVQIAQFEDDVAAIDERSAELDQREVDLDKREADLAVRATDLDSREAAVSSAEADYEAGTIPGDGIYLVGTDIQPGQYRGNDGGESCYWARLSGTSGDFSDLIANDNADGPTVVTIAASDAAFETNRCGEWHLVP